MKNNQKAIIALVVLVVILGAVYFGSKKAAPAGKAPVIMNVTEMVATSSDAQATTTEASYVSVVGSTTHEARFTFNVAIDVKDVTMANVKPCVAETSAAGASVPCQPPNKFAVSYDAAKKIVTVSETNIDKKNKDVFGIFRTGCASCKHIVSFSNIHSADGKLLPSQTIFVY